MRLLAVFARAYPGRSLLMLLCLMVAGVAEGIGLSSLLPLLQLVTKSGGGAGTDDSTLERYVNSGFAAVGLVPTMGSLLAVIVGGMIVKAGLVLVAQRHVGYAVAQVATDLRLSLLRALLRARWEYYVRQPIGGLANAFATEALRASQAYFYATTIVALGVESLVYVALAAAVSWQATIGAITVGSLTIYILNRLVRMARRAGAKQTRLTKTLLERFTDVLYAVKPLKAMSRENLIGPLLESETLLLNRSLQRQVLSKEALRALQEPLLVATIAGGLYVAVSRWALPLDNVILLALVFGRLLGDMHKVQKQYQAMATCDSAFWSLRSTIDASEAVREVTTGTRAPVFEHAVALDGVTLAYGDHVVLGDLSVTIPAGRITVILGPSGAGKTSILDLITGLVRPQSGDVTIDGIALGELDLHAWRRQIGYVPQETFLLHESIAANVTLGEEGLTEADVERALRAAGAWDFVARLPEGIHTPAGERGARFSGGQRQRVLIARALVHNPRLLILDEATASLDPVSEAAICDTIRELRGKVAVLAVSHQTAILDVADKVYRLEDGSVEELEVGKTLPLRAQAGI